jgi:hypothetical protein
VIDDTAGRLSAGVAAPSSEPSRRPGLRASMEIHIESMEVHVNDDADFAALYINGELVTADSFVAVVANVMSRFNIGFVQDNAFMRGADDEFAATVAEVADFRQRRDGDLARAEQLRAEAEALEARYT